MKYRYRGKDYSPEELPLVLFRQRGISHTKKYRREHSLAGYYKNKDKWIQRVKDWKKRNPEKNKLHVKKYFTKWYSTNRGKEYMKKYNLNYYHTHLESALSRSNTYKIFKNIPKYCKKCFGKDNVEIHHELYPKSTIEIRKAIQNNKIYYLCRTCHKKVHN